MIAIRGRSGVVTLNGISPSSVLRPAGKPKGIHNISHSRGFSFSSTAAGLMADSRGKEMNVRWVLNYRAACFKNEIRLHQLRRQADTIVFISKCIIYDYNLLASIV